MRTVVFVRRSGGHKAKDVWLCGSEGEALALQKWLRHLGVKGVEVISLGQHGRLPDHQPES